MTTMTWRSKTVVTQANIWTLKQSRLKQKCNLTFIFGRETFHLVLLEFVWHWMTLNETSSLSDIEWNWWTGSLSDIEWNWWTGSLRSVSKHLIDYISDLEINTFVTSYLNAFVLRVKAFVVRLCYVEKLFVYDNIKYCCNWKNKVWTRD